ncbi:MAG: hypothetical protein V7631_1584 [Massilia sp.]|jgi:hypothetical protein
MQMTLIYLIVEKPDSEKLNTASIGARANYDEVQDIGSMTVATLHRVTEVQSAIGPGAADIEIRFESGATEQDRAAVMNRIAPLEFGSDIKLTPFPCTFGRHALTQQAYPHIAPVAKV